MEWEKSCCIGFDVIDSKREELFHVYRKLVARQSEDPPNAVIAAVKVTVEYAKYIFMIEEELMRDLFYPDLVDHIKEHNELRKEVVKCLVHLKANDKVDFNSIVRFLLKWLDSHILGADLKFAEYRNHNIHDQEASKKEQEAHEIMQRPIVKINKLKDLFKEKLISSEDFKDSKIKIFVEHCKEKGLAHLRESLNELEIYQKSDHLSEKERKSVVVALLEQLDLEKSLLEIDAIEGKLILLNSFFELELLEEDRYQTLKSKVLSQI